MIRKTNRSHPVVRWAVPILALVAGLTLGSARALAQDDPMQQLGRHAPLRQSGLARTAAPAHDPDLMPLGPVHPNRRPPKVPEQYTTGASPGGSFGTHGSAAALRPENWLERVRQAFGRKRD